MLSQFIDGDDDDAVRDPYYYSQLENFSTSNDDHSSCAYDSVYDRLLGCSGCVRSSTTTDSGPCVSLFLHWVKLALGGAIKAYLNNPLCLALLPLVVGAGFGFWMGRRNGSSISEDETMGNYPGKQPTGNKWMATFLGRVSRLYHWLTLNLMLIVISLDPRRCCSSSRSIGSQLFQDNRDEQARMELKAPELQRESGVESQFIPRHIAVIMDGNRRYGKTKYGNATRGHWDGSKTLTEFSKWCIAEGIQILTVYAFSTENWDRDPAEISALMAIFCKYCDELRVEAVQRGIRIHVLATEKERIPENVRIGMDRMVLETRHCDKFTMNICLSYGGRGEIVNACKSIAMDVQSGKLNVDQVGENTVQAKLLTGHCCDPDIIIRTSGEERLSNFLLWQVAYSEFFFLKKQWPELQKDDLLEVIRTFANGRKRRYGK